MGKIANMAIIVTMTWLFLYTHIAYSKDISSLRVPIEIDKNKIVTALISEFKKTDNMDSLLGYATKYPELIKLIVDSLPDFEAKREFIYYLEMQDATRPNFNLQIIPQNLFPIEEISKSIGLRREDMTSAITSFEPETAPLMIASIKYRDTVLAEIVIKPRRTLVVSKKYQEHLPEDIREVLWDETASGYCASETGITRVYYNLNWRAEIVKFVLSPSLQGKGIGPIWYRNYIEPYLRNCGFSIIAAQGTCFEADLPMDVKKFWRSLGFSDPFPINRAPTADTVVYSISVKRLQTSPQEANARVLDKYEIFDGVMDSTQRATETGM